MRRRPLAITALLILAITPSILPAPAQALVNWTVIAAWEMDEPGSGCSPNNEMEDLAPDPTTQRGNNTGTIQSFDATFGVARNGSGSCPNGTIDLGRYEFRNWSSYVANDTLVEDIGIPANTGQVIVSDGSNLLNPAMKSFKFTMRFKPTNVVRTVGGVTDWFLPEFQQAGATLNVLQKGFNLGVGGQMKIELRASGSNLGKLRCTFSDEDLRQVQVQALVATNFDPTRSNKFECGINRETGVAFITVFENHDGPVPAADQTNTTALPAGFSNVKPKPNPNALYIGQKPDSGDEADAFSGKIYYALMSLGNP